MAVRCMGGSWSRARYHCRTTGLIWMTSGRKERLSIEFNGKIMPYLNFNLLVLTAEGVFIIYSLWKRTGGDPTELAEES